MRRLNVLIRALPVEALLWAVIEQAEKKALKPTADQIRDRAAYYAQRAKEAE